MYGDGTITNWAVRNWFVKFLSGDTSLKDEPRPGRSSNFDAEALKSLVECNARQSTRELAGKLNASQSTICRHLEKMEKVSKLGVWFPHALSEKNKADQLSIATSLLSRQRNNPFLDKIITGDEKWITYDNVARKRKWADKNKSPQPDPKAELHGRKIMLCVWWDRRGIIHFKLLSRNETFTADLYVQQLQHIHQSLLEKCPALVKWKNVVLLHDNTRPHTA